jgi:DNA topoisomerase I
MRRNALYQLIWRQFVACQMTPAQYDSTTLTVKAGDYSELRAKGRTLRFDGWTRVMPALRKPATKTACLAAIEVGQGDAVELQQLIPTSTSPNRLHVTAKPALVKELEKRGIGRPSTYAVDHFDHSGSRLCGTLTTAVSTPKKWARSLLIVWKQNFRELMNYDFTARMEDGLDQVANNHAEWKAVLDEFFALNSAKQLETAEKDPEEGGMRPNQMMMTSIECPTCGRPMGIRTASTGVFLGCSGYAHCHRKSAAKPPLT